MADTRPATILVVEDEPGIRRLIRTHLAQDGFVVIEAAGAEEASGVVQGYAGQISLAIVNIAMPGASGLDFANEMSVRCPEMKILYVSGLKESVAVGAISERAPKAILLKPFSYPELRACVQRLLEGE